MNLTASMIHCCVEKCPYDSRRRSVVGFKKSIDSFFLINNYNKLFTMMNWRTNERTTRLEMCRMMMMMMNIFGRNKTKLTN